MSSVNSILEKYTVTNLKTEAENLSSELSNTEKMCPRCGKPGSGPFRRWVANNRGKRYWAFYFAHRHGKNTQWCYLSKKMRAEFLDKQVLGNAERRAEP